MKSDEQNRIQQLEQALHDAEERLRRKNDLIDLSMDAIFAWDEKSNNIIFWSKGAERTYGWKREEAEGHVVSRLLLSQFPEPISQIIKTLHETGHWEGDVAQSCKDGRKIVVASRWALGHEDSDSGIVSVLEVNREVTEQRQLEAERDARARDKERIAEMLQQSLLMSPSPEVFDGVTIKAIYQGAEDDVLVGGDFFDIFALSDNKVALTVGDATGKGLNAAIYTAEIKFAFRAFLRDTHSPSKALSKLNTFVADAERLDGRRVGDCYAALAIAVVDAESGEVQVSTAGSERPVLLRTSGEWAEFAIGGPLLGVVPGFSYIEYSEVMGQGDTLIVTTDGLVEARNEKREFYGTERLVNSVKDSIALDGAVADIALRVVEMVRAYAGGAINDDVCLILARRK